jgi:photosystem II stability/assembly factor-like uncharacterized protein
MGIPEGNNTISQVARQLGLWSSRGNGSVYGKLGMSSCEYRDGVELDAMMPQSCLRLAGVLLIPISFLCAVPSRTTVGQPSHLPFEISWTAGSCSNCEIVQSLGEVFLTGPRTIWANGYFFPTEGQGAGDYSVVRSSDYGRHWVEIPKSRMHAVEPSISFIDSKTGCISGMSPDATSWVLRTNDGGRHWAQVSDHFIQNMQFVNEGTAVGDEFDGATDQFAKTTDGGRTWKISALPGLKFASKVRFLNPEVGWIAGTNDISDDLNGRVAVLLRTTDGGQHWDSFQIPSQTGVAEVRDLYFLNESLGWLITWYYNNDGTHLYLTTDGGKTWRVHPDQTIQGPGKWLSVVRFLNSKIGFAFSRDNQVEAVAKPSAIGVVTVAKVSPTGSGRLLYTDDGGEHWRPRLLDAWVYDCQVLGQSLACSASGDKSSFLMLQIRTSATSDRK